MLIFLNSKKKNNKRSKTAAAGKGHEANLRINMNAEYVINALKCPFWGKKVGK